MAWDCNITNTIRAMIIKLKDFIEMWISIGENLNIQVSRVRK